MPRNVFAAIAAVLLVLPALAHGPADWIMQGQHKNAAGEWCCEEGDCFVVRAIYVSPGRVPADAPIEVTTPDELPLEQTVIA
jgi:hypothetical protein